jgi:protein-S-isoprenylcysteine O-methyltransferase Ste14
MNLRLATSRTLLIGSIALACVTERTWTEDSPASLAMQSAGLAMTLFGAFGRVWCAGHIAGRKNKDLVALGPYSMMRNPLYFFSMFAFVGSGLCFESLTLGLIFLAVFLVTHWPTILSEEKYLRGAFGADYDAYCARVPRFLPNPALFVKATEVTISIKAFNRALFEAALMPLAYLGAQGILRLHDAGVLPGFVKFPF